MSFDMLSSDVTRDIKTFKSAFGKLSISVFMKFITSGISVSDFTKIYFMSFGVNFREQCSLVKSLASFSSPESSNDFLNRYSLISLLFGTNLHSDS